jgi:hypothetical protein
VVVKTTRGLLPVAPSVPPVLTKLIVPVVPDARVRLVNVSVVGPAAAGV